MSARASASACTRITASTWTASCAQPIPRSIMPRKRGAAITSFSRLRSTRRRSAGWRWPTGCGARWRGTHSRCISSRKSIWRAGRFFRRKPCCAIGKGVLRESCRQLRRWHDMGYTHLRIAVNLSPRQFSQPDFESVITRILEETGLPAAALDLEITEGMLAQPSENNIATLERLSLMGIQLSIDDFGTGYSNLAYLQRFPIHALKIDRSFVSSIGHDTNDTALVKAIIAMANSLHLKVLAEGVETAQQVDFLKSHGCPLAQGFYYCEALTADAFTNMLHTAGSHLLAVDKRRADC